MAKSTIKHIGGSLAYKDDNRYSLQREYDGSINQPVYIRFCGEVIGKADTIEEAQKIGKAHAAKRNKILTEV
jgi:hypothetical protein